ncbi:hypothetical protein [Sporosarcina sp. FSL K6-5500]|uniref:hypothetical protein n=1 Tax=Sporosarcina sp. FSL K6-5500 TaxID=2921558 RepID=UPI0030F9E0A8
MNSDIDFKGIWNNLSHKEKVAFSVIKNTCHFGTSYVCYADYTPDVLKNLGHAEDADQRANNGTMSKLRAKKLIESEDFYLGTFRSFHVTQLGINVIFHSLMSIDKFIEDKKLTFDAKPRIGY